MSRTAHRPESSKASEMDAESNARLARSIELAKVMESDSSRTEIPVRRSFVRAKTASEKAPLAQLVSTRGRGGEVALKLYLALLWRCSSPPYDTEIPAGRWAELLGLPEPRTLGARRVAKALVTLEKIGLVKLEPRAGDSTLVTLLNESGSGRRYVLPSTASAKANSEEARKRNLYFKVPLRLWTRGEIQTMSAPGVAMLLVLLDSRNRDGSPTWWSTKYFPDTFGLSAAARTKGTGELIDRNLVRVIKQLVDQSNGKSLGRERVRHTYVLRGDARPAEMIAAQQEQRTKSSLASRRVLRTRSLKKPSRISQRSGGTS